MKLLEPKIIKIGDKEYPVKLSVRAMIEYQKLSGHDISQVKSLEDVTFLFYSALKAGGESITYEQFMDLIDNNPEAIGNFSDAMLEPSEKKQEGQ